MQRLVVAKKVQKFKALGYKVIKKVRPSAYGAGSVMQYLMEKPDPVPAPAPKVEKPVKKK